MVHCVLLGVGGVMQGVFFLEEAVREDRVVRRKVHQVLDVFAGEVMQGYKDRQCYDCPQSQDEDYLSGWRIGEETLVNKTL